MFPGSLSECRLKRFNESFLIEKGEMMINPFTVAGKIEQIQKDVLEPLYGTPEQEHVEFDSLLRSTGEVIAKYQDFFLEVSSSSLVAMIFKIIKLFGGADGLTEEDFSRFTSYVNDGGLQAMITMLKSDDKEQTFVEELGRLDAEVRTNAAPMLTKSRELHSDFIQGYLIDNYGSVADAPEEIQENFSKSDAFISRLAGLAVEVA